MAASVPAPSAHRREKSPEQTISESRRVVREGTVRCSTGRSRPSSRPRRRESRLRSQVRPHLHHLRRRKISRRNSAGIAAAPRQRPRNRTAHCRRRTTQNHAAAPGEIAGLMSSPVTTHVLDISIGRPAQGVAVTLLLQTAGTEWKEIARGVTALDGRLANLLPSNTLATGNYRLRFETGAYFAARQSAAFYPFVEVTFAVIDAGQHYHVPLLVSPYGYTTYRGS